MKIAARRASIAMAMQSAISLVPDDYNPAQASMLDQSPICRISNPR